MQPAAAAAAADGTLTIFPDSMELNRCVFAGTTVEGNRRPRGEASKDEAKFGNSSEMGEGVRVP